MAFKCKIGMKLNYKTNGNATISAWGILFSANSVRSIRTKAKMGSRLLNYSFVFSADISKGVYAKCL